MVDEELHRRFDAARDKVGPAGRRVLDFLRMNPVAALASSAVNLAEKSETSDATVIRTVQALGFKGLPELKQAVVRASQAGGAAQDMRRTLTGVGPWANAIDTVLAVHEEGLLRLRSQSVRDRLVEAASMLDRAQRVVLFGLGPSASLAHYASCLINRLGRASRVVDQAGPALADQILDLRLGDVMLCMAYGDPYPEIRVVLSEAKRALLPTLLITDDPDAELGAFADVVVPVPRGKPGYFAQHGVTLVALETLVLALAAAAPSNTLGTLDRLAALRQALKG